MTASEKPADLYALLGVSSTAKEVEVFANSRVVSMHRCLVVWITHDGNASCRGEPVGGGNASRSSRYSSGANHDLSCSMQIRRAYRNLVTREHPDKGGDAEKFRLIQQAYEVLSDVNKANSL